MKCAEVNISRLNTDGINKKNICDSLNECINDSFGCNEMCTVANTYLHGTSDCTIDGDDKNNKIKCKSLPKFTNCINGTIGNSSKEFKKRDCIDSVNKDFVITDVENRIQDDRQTVSDAADNDDYGTPRDHGNINRNCNNVNVNVRNVNDYSVFDNKSLNFAHVNIVNLPGKSDEISFCLKIILLMCLGLPKLVLVRQYLIILLTLEITLFIDMMNKTHNEQNKHKQNMTMT